MQLQRQLVYLMGQPDFTQKKLLGKVSETSWGFCKGVTAFYKDLEFGVGDF